MANSLSNLVSNLAEGLQKSNVNIGVTLIYAKSVKLNTKIVGVFLNTQTLKII